MTSSKRAPNYFVAVSEDGSVGLSSGASYGYINGFNSAASLKGEFSDWIFAKGVNEGFLQSAPTKITDPPTAVTMMGFGAWSGTGDIWLGVPIAAAGWRTFGVSLTSSLSHDLNVSAYLVPEINDPAGFLGSNITVVGGPLFAFPVIPAATILTASNGGPLVFAGGGTDGGLFTAFPQNYLLIRFQKTTTPTSGNIRIGIARQR